MPLDPSIPLAATVAQIQSPYEALGQLAQLQQMREQAAAQREAAEARRLAGEEKRTLAQRQRAVGEAYRRAITVGPDGTPSINYAQLVQDAGLPPELAPTVIAEMQQDAQHAIEFDTARLGREEKRAKYLGSAAQTVIAAQGNPFIWGVELLAAKQLGVIDDAKHNQLARIQDPQQILTLAKGFAARAGGAEPPAMMNVPAGGVVFDPVTRQPVFTNARQTPTEGFTLSPGATRFGPAGEVIATVPPTPGAAGGADAFTLSPGQTRYGAGGQVIAAVPPAPAGGAGGRGVTSADAGRIADLDTSRDDLATLSTALTAAGATGTVAATGAAMPKWVTDLTGWGVDAKKKQALIDRVKQVIGKALEGGVLRKEDEVKYEKILPTIGDAPELVVSKLRGLDAAIAQRRTTHLDALADAGYDVSRFQARPARPPLGETGGDRFTVTAPNGTTYSFNSAAEAAAFKRRAGIP